MSADGRISRFGGHRPRPYASADYRQALGQAGLIASMTIARWKQLPKGTTVCTTALIAVTCAIFGCSKKASQMHATEGTADTLSSDYESVASFLPGKVSAQELGEFFRKHNIKYVLEGSRAFQISVPKPLAKKTTELLKASDFRSRLTIYNR